MRQPDHRQKLLMPGAGFAAPPGRWPTQNRWIWPSIMANQPLAMPAQTRSALAYEIARLELVTFRDGDPWENGRRLSAA